MSYLTLSTSSLSIDLVMESKFLLWVLSVMEDVLQKLIYKYERINLFCIEKI